MFQPTSPFPARINNGAVVTDERCTCGALRSQHEHTISYGHGPRIVGGVVVCEKFTWISWVFTTMLVPAGFERLDDRHVVKIERANKRSVGAKGYRYEVRDMSAPVPMAARGRDPFGHRLFTCAAPAARSKAQAKEHAAIELRRYLERWACPSDVPGCTESKCRHVAPPDHAPIHHGGGAL